MARFSFRKKLMKGENALLKAIEFANAHGRLLGVLRYLSFRYIPVFCSEPEPCPTTDIFPISTYIGCNRLVYIPDHLLLCVLIEFINLKYQSWSLSTDTTDYNPVYNYKLITTKIDYNLELFWVVIETDYDRYRS